MYHSRLYTITLKITQSTAFEIIQEKCGGIKQMQVHC